MKNLNKLKNMERNSKNEYFNANGGDWANADWANADWANADATAAAPTSEPLIIQVTNNATTAIANVVLFGSNANRNAVNYGNNSNISVISSIGNVSYLQMLANSESKPTKFGELWMVSTTAGQLQQTMGITHITDTGDSLTKTVTFTKNPFQTQTDTVISKYEFM